MSSVNYNLKSKGIRLISSKDAWRMGKDGKYYLNREYQIVGKVDSRMSNMIVSAADNKKPKYKGDVSELNRTAKSQMIDHFYDENGKRNKNTVAYFGVEKKK